MTIFSFQMRYGSTWGPHHKNLSPNTTTVIFDADEYVTGIEAYCPGWCQSFHIFTNKNNYGPFGTHPSSGLSMKHCLSNEQLAYISGRYAFFFDTLSFHFVTGKTHTNPLIFPLEIYNKQVFQNLSAAIRKCTYLK